MMIQGKIEEMSEVTAKTGKIYRKIKVNGKTYQDFQNDIGIYHITGKVGDEIAFEVLEKKVGEILYRNIVKQVDAPQVQKVQHPVKIQPKKEEEFEMSEANAFNMEDKIEAIEASIKSIEHFVAEDYDQNMSKLDAVIQTQARTEEMIKLIAKKIGIEQSEEFRKASEI